MSAVQVTLTYLVQFVDFLFSNYFSLSYILSLSILKHSFIHASMHVYIQTRTHTHIYACCFIDALLLACGGVHEGNDALRFVFRRERDGLLIG